MPRDRNAERLKAWTVFRQSYGLKVTGETRRQFEMYWTQRQTEYGGPLYLDADEVEQIGYWMEEKGWSQRDRQEFLDEHPDLWRDPLA